MLHVVIDFRRGNSAWSDQPQFETDAAEIGFFDDRGFEAELCRADRGDIATGPEPMMMTSKDVSAMLYNRSHVTGLPVCPVIARSTCDEAIQPAGGALIASPRSHDGVPLAARHTIIITGFSIRSLNARSFGAERAVDRA